MYSAGRRAPGALTLACRHLLLQQRCISIRSHGPISFTLSIGESASKEQVVRTAQARLSEFQARWRSKPARSPDAAVVLASKNLVRWLEDESFVSGLLEPYRDAQLGPDASQTFHTLEAVIDRAPALRRREQLHGEITVLHGKSNRLLPGLWPPADAEAPASESSELPSVTLSGIPMGPHLPTLDATVPLATTLFTNGRPHTMFASRWQADGASPFRLAHRVPKTTQRVVLPDLPGLASQMHVNIVSVTRPRKIVAGLGNIVRQVEGDGGEVVPASKELEVVIPEVLRALEASGEGRQPGPIGVWALVIPESLMKEQIMLEPFDRDWKVIHQVLAGGGRLCKILSGGGGWGDKQGLLSLDPQSRYTLPDEEDVESFIRSFHGDTSPGAGSMATPGSYVQFFIEGPPPAPAAPELARPFVVLPFPKFTVGTQDDAAPAPAAAGEGTVCLTANLFGAISSKGIYLASTPGTKNGGADRPAISTKIDAGDSVIFTTEVSKARG